MEHHRAGRLAEAAELYRRILESEPEQTDALYLLGLLAYQSGEPERAVELERRSLAVRPDQAQCQNVLGLALAALGRGDEAEASFAQAIALERAPEFYNNLGNLCRDRGRTDEAMAAYGQAVALDPRFADAHYNLGNAQRERGELARAEQSLRRAVEADPAHGNALAALGQVLLATDRAEAALPFLERALARQRQDAGLYCDVGDALQRLGRRRQAIARYQGALRLDPRRARGWYAAGCAEAADGEYANARFCFGRALEIAPEWPEARHNLGDALYNLGQVDQSLGEFRRAASGERPELPRAMIAVIIPGSPDSSQAEILEARREFAAQDLPPARPVRSLVSRGDGRLCVGYLSSFFHRHNWMKPVWGLINAHDRARLAIHLFSDAPEAAIRHGYRRHPEDTFHDISGLSNEEAAALVEAAAIDLLVDLNGYSKLRRLPLVAMKPAPLLAGWFNHYASSGIAAYDYLVGDGVVIPPEDEPYYSEKIARVPGTYLAFAVDYPAPPVADPPCLAGGAITFGSLASQYKITPAVIAAWSRILRATPGARLLLRNSALGAEGNREFVRDAFAAHGIGAERLRLEGPAEHEVFLRTYDEIDIALDPFPYNGGTTTTEAIWQGVPVVTFRGDRWASRTSASILNAAGLGAWVAQNREEYIELAARLAGSPAQLAESRRGMRERLPASPACDTAAFARQMEALYARMAAAAIPLL